MKSNSKARRWFGVLLTPRGAILTGAISAVAALASLSAVAANATAATKQAKASGPVVKILAPGVQDSALYVIASRQGFFKQQHVNADVVTENVGSGSQALADFLSGQYQFINEGVSTGVVAIGSGAKLKAVVGTDISEPLQIAITDSFAKKHHIPTANKTTAEALKQLKALKHSHATIAVTTTGSATYFSLLALCKAHGLTCGLNKSSDDLDIVTSGTTEVMTAGILAGKYDAIADVVPQSLQPHTVQIPIGNLPPLSVASDYDLTTTPAYIAAHKKIVQGVVTATVEAWEWAQTHPKPAEKDLAYMEKSVDINSASEDKILYSYYSAFWRTPLLLQSAFTKEIGIVRAGGVKTSVTYSQYNDPTFAEKAVNDLGVAAPTTPAPPASL